MTEQDAEKNYASWGGLTFLILVLLALMYAGFVIADWLEDEQQAPIHQIVVSGERQFVEDEQVRKLIREKHPGSFFELNVEQVHLDLEDMPWIYRASVRKRWPNSLNIYVVEQVAAARWNSDLILNQFGESFPAQAPELDLPELFGPGGSEQTALQGYMAMQSLLERAELNIQELTLSERFAWNIKLDNGVRLNLGRNEFVDRLQRFVDLYPLLKKQQKEVDYVDLRYDTGLAVGWKSDQASEQES